MLPLPHSHDWVPIGTSVVGTHTASCGDFTVGVALMYEWATKPQEPVITIAEYTGQCSCNDPGDCANCPDKEYDEGGEA